ncbi:MAG: M12 family metallo-peptidase, partial [Bacteroidota bacterium]
LTLKEEDFSTLRYTAPAQLQLPLPKSAEETMVLLLEKVNPAVPTVLESATDSPVQVDHAVHYRGHIQGDPQSMVAISLLDGEVMGLVSSSALGGNWVLGSLAHTDKTAAPNEYIFYPDHKVFQEQPFLCSTPDTGESYSREELSEPESTGRSLNNCVKVYFEVNYDIYQDKGSTQATVQYVEGLFNQVAAIYASEQIKLSISEIYVWNTPSPYNGTNSGQMLTDFQNIRTSFNGDLAQLLSYQASGGIAVVNGLCHPYNMAKMSYSGISSNFSQVPTYSWSVMVVAHELGHLLGSQHTHACVWNGNSTALDGCPGYTEGSCSVPGSPAGGGTIMSYCHLSNVGINLSLGLGTQPGNLMRNRVANANCLTTCHTGGDGNNGGGDPPVTATCVEEEVFFRLRLDTYPKETTWTLRSATGAVVAQGGPYPKSLANQLVQDTFCLPQACYTFRIQDVENDGLCCAYGQGSYSLVDAAGQVLAQGGSFPASEETSFCLPYQNGGEDCTSINFNDYTLASYGVNQDAGQVAVQDGGQTVYLANNAWKSIDVDYEITPSTMLAFDFKSTREGEIHGIGFDNNANISFGYTFKVHGYQAWGINAFDNYAGNGQWQTYALPVGEYYTGVADRLFFVADHDSGLRNGNAWFRNVRIYEGEDCQTENLPAAASPSAPAHDQRVKVYPNPVLNGQLNLRTTAVAEGLAHWEVLSLTGQSLARGTQSLTSGHVDTRIPLPQFSSGTYLLRWRDELGEQTLRFAVQ